MQIEEIKMKGWTEGAGRMGTPRQEGVYPVGSVSREAMISFVETFADTYGIGISYILEGNI